MNINFLGVELSLAVIADRESRVVLALESAEEALLLDGVTFSAVVVAHEVESDMPIAAIDGLAGRVSLVIPPLAEGRHRFEVVATNDAGESSTLVHGWIGAFSMIYQQDVANCHDRTLRVIVPEREGDLLLVGWQASSAAMIAAEQARAWASQAQESAESVGDIIARAEMAVETAEEAVEKLDVVDAKLALFDDKIASAVIPNPHTNTWWIAGKDTFVPVTGEDGKSPQISNVGTWMLWDEEQYMYVDSGEKAVPDDGCSPYISPLGTWVTFDPLEGWIDTGVQAQGVNGLNGVSMRRVMIESVDELPEGEELGVYYYILNAQDAFDVYAWLETPDGVGSWVMIGEANDIATAEVHGLVKLGTDALIEQGAAVGNDESGGLSVPLASIDTAGAVVISFNEVIESGATIGFDEAGKLRVRTATMQDYGSVRLSMSATAQDGCIGLMANGMIGTRRATLYHAGTVKLGSSIQQVNPQPYIIGVGATSDGQIANNILRKGAIQHQRMGGWTAHGMDWLDESAASNPAYYTAEDYYLGLAHTAQFSQSEGEGLELLSASSSMIAGVYIATSIDDTRPEAVMSASGLSAHLSENYYTKGEIYTKGETQAADNVVKNWVSSNYVSKSSLEALGYATKQELAQGLATKMNTTPTVTRIEALTKAEFDALPARDATTLYICPPTQ